MPAERSLAPPRRRARLSVTSLIDVIFLLLLFFMLSSTFSRYAEIELTAATGGGGASSETRPVFLQLAPGALAVNGAEIGLEGLPDRLVELAGEEGQQVIVSLREGVDAQRLTDLLVILRKVPELSVTVLD